MPVTSTLRRPSKGEDAAHTRAEEAVRVRPRRSIVRELDVRPVAPSVVEPLVVGEHYLHSMPPAAVACFGVYLEGALVGAVVLTAGARHVHRLLVGARSGDVLTLARLWLADDVPHNAESRVISVVCRLLARERRAKALVSYADPTAGHTGTIYRAAGWVYLGMSESGRYIDVGDGKGPRHPRSIFSSHQTNRPTTLRRQGYQAHSVIVPGKHRYLVMLDRSWEWRLVNGAPARS